MILSSPRGKESGKFNAEAQGRREENLVPLRLRASATPR